MRHMHRNDAFKQIRVGEEQELGEFPESANLVDGKWSTLKRVVRAWWDHHPANVALDIAKPLVGQCARKYPFRVLGIAAGVGAAFIFFKPWRLMSLGGIVLAAMKPSDITGVVLSMLTPSSQDSNNQQGNK